MAGGWIKLHRSLLHHPMWLEERFTPGQAWVDLLMQANHEATKVLQGNIWIPVQRGQVFTSQAELAARWKWDRQTVRRFLRALESDNTIYIRTSRQTETGYSMLSIQNYERYQGCGQTSLDTQNQTGFPIGAPSDAPSESRNVPHPMPHPNPPGTAGNLGTCEQSGEADAPSDAPSESASNEHPTPHFLRSKEKKIHSRVWDNGQVRDISARVIGELNALTGRSFRSDAKHTVSHIKARLEEGYTEEDLRLVVQNRVAKWLHDSKQSEYLRPETLFRPSKFEGYLQAAQAPKPKSDFDQTMDELRGET